MPTGSAVIRAIPIPVAILEFGKGLLSAPSFTPQTVGMCAWKNDRSGEVAGRQSPASNLCFLMLLSRTVILHRKGNANNTAGTVRRRGKSCKEGWWLETSSAGLLEFAPAEATPPIFEYIQTIKASTALKVTWWIPRQIIADIRPLHAHDVRRFNYQGRIW
jgi:hypothetical protein